MKDLSVRRMNRRACWGTFIGLHCLAILLMLLCVADTRWVRQDSEEPWEGSLKKVYSATAAWEEQTYYSLSDTYCTESSTSPGPTSEQEALCSLFTKLNRAGTFFIFFEVISILGVLLSVLIIVAYIVELDVLKASFCSSACSFIAHGIGTLVYSRTVNISFGGNCDGDWADGRAGVVCADSGAFLMLLLLLLLPLIVFPFAATVSYTRRSTAKKVGAPMIVVNKPESSTLTMNTEKTDGATYLATEPSQTTSN